MRICSIILDIHLYPNNSPLGLERSLSDNSTDCSCRGPYSDYPISGGTPPPVTPAPGYSTSSLDSIGTWHNAHIHNSNKYSLKVTVLP